MNSVEETLWIGNKQAAFASLREALRTAVEISEETITNAVLVAAGRPTDPDVLDELAKATTSALRKRKILGLAFPPVSAVFRMAARRKIRTVENIKIDYPDALDGVKVRTNRSANGSAVITITTQGIESEETVADSISNVRKLT